MSELQNDIRKYLQNELSATERHTLEKRALHDPFLADALEGVEQISGAEFSKDVRDLNRRILSKETKPILSPLRIAAGILLLAAAGVVVFQFSESQKPERLGFQDETPRPESAGDSLSDFTEENKAGTEGQVDHAETETIKAEDKPTQPLLADAEKSSGDMTKDEERPTAPLTRSAGDTSGVKEAMVLAEDAPVAVETGERQEVTAKEPVAEPLASSEALRRSKSMAESGAGVTAQNYVKGRVTSEDGAPLPGVNVAINGSTTGTLTDTRGNFQIYTEEAAPTLTFSFIGLASQKVKVENSQEAVSVQMKQDVDQWSEVVVTGYGVSAGDNKESATPYPTLRLAQPGNGKESFQDYLRANMIYPKIALDNKIEGSVTVEFSVNKEGQLSDFSVIKGIGYGCDEELIRLIKSGPQWTPTSRNGIALEEKVKVRFSFQLPR